MPRKALGIRAARRYGSHERRPANAGLLKLPTRDGVHSWRTPLITAGIGPLRTPIRSGGTSWDDNVPHATVTFVTRSIQAQRG